MINDLQRTGQATRRVEYKLRDWTFSRQRYWGEPIPIYFPVDTDGDPRSGDASTIRYDEPIAVDESELPVCLPDLADYKPGDDPSGVLARVMDWRFFQRDGQWYARETNTMPQWAGSCWYYLRFVDPQNDKVPFSKKAADRWLPVDLYVGGVEHAVLHLLYARFWHQVLYDEGLVSTKEPFVKLVHQGMILGEGGQKMSKSRGNVVNPDDIVSRFGADAMRVYEMFMGPLVATKPWNTDSIAGVHRFLDRVYAIVQMTSVNATLDDATRGLLHRTFCKVTEDIEALRFNTAISAMMILSHELFNIGSVPTEAADTLVRLIHPFAPHLGEEMWTILGHEPSIQDAPWPQFEPSFCEEDHVGVPVQVNGKVRGHVQISKTANEDQALHAALAVDNVAHKVEGKTVHKVVWVPGKVSQPNCLNTFAFDDPCLRLLMCGGHLFFARWCVYVPFDVCEDLFRDCLKCFKCACPYGSYPLELFSSSMVEFATKLVDGRYI